MKEGMDDCMVIKLQAVDFRWKCMNSQHLQIMHNGNLENWTVFDVLIVKHVRKSFRFLSFSICLDDLKESGNARFSWSSPGQRANNRTTYVSSALSPSWQHMKRCIIFNGERWMKTTSRDGSKGKAMKLLSGERWNRTRINLTSENLMDMLLLSCSAP
jgi:hypothetical protein